MDRVKRSGTLIVMRDRPDPRKKAYMPWTTGGRNPMRWVQAEVRRIRMAAGLPEDITFTGFRHGGHTDGADSGLTDAQIVRSAVTRPRRHCFAMRKTPKNSVATASARGSTRERKGGICQNEQVTSCQNVQLETALSC